MDVKNDNGNNADDNENDKKTGDNVNTDRVNRGNIRCENNLKKSFIDDDNNAANNINDNNFMSIVIEEELYLDSKVNGQAIVRMFGYRCPECNFSATSRRLILHHNSEIHCSSGLVSCFFLWGRP